MSVQTLRRVPVIRHTIKQPLMKVKSGALRELRIRHIRRLIEQGEQAGDRGLESPQIGNSRSRTKALTRYETLLGDLRPTWTAECHGITLSDETMRQWLRAYGIEHFTRWKRSH